MLTLLSGKNIADPRDDYDENDPRYMRDEPSVVKAKSKKSKDKQSAAVNEEGSQQRKKGRNKSAAVVNDSDSDAARKDTQKDVQNVEGKKRKKGKKGAENETVIDVDELPTSLGDNPPAAASVSAPAPADTVSTPVIIPTSGPAPAAATALDARDGSSTAPTPVSRAEQRNIPFASSPNEVQDILMTDISGSLDDLNIGFMIESSSRSEDNDMSSPISKVLSYKYTIYLLTSTGSFITKPKQFI